MENKITCKHIECNEMPIYIQSYCKFHYLGGVFGNGETYEQYQVIEQDFIDFIKIIPINDENNLKVYSPVLRDIIIRCSVQIEIFFKEWGKYECSENIDNELYKLYNEIDKKTRNVKGARNWNFRDYFYLKEKYVKYNPLHIRETDTEMDSFSTWTSREKIPEWWDVYNAIKHDGIKSKSKVNLQSALESLAALFSLHCANNHSKNYLKNFSSVKVSSGFDKINVKIDQITTPLDSKRYLFRDIYSSFGKGIEIEKSKDNYNRASGIGKKV